MEVCGGPLSWSLTRFLSQNCLVSCSSSQLRLYCGQSILLIGYVACICTRRPHLKGYIFHCPVSVYLLTYNFTLNRLSCRVCFCVTHPEMPSHGRRGAPVQLATSHVVSELFVAQMLFCCYDSSVFL